MDSFTSKYVIQSRYKIDNDSIWYDMRPAMEVADAETGLKAIKRMDDLEPGLEYRLVLRESRETVVISPDLTLIEARP